MCRQFPLADELEEDLTLIRVFLVHIVWERKQ